MSAAPETDAPTGSDQLPAGDFAEPTPGIVQEYRADRKTFKNLHAKAAAAGHTLMACGSGYVLSKWGFVRHCSDLDSVQAALQQMGVAP